MIAGGFLIACGIYAIRTREKMIAANPWIDDSSPKDVRVNEAIIVVGSWLFILTGVAVGLADLFGWM